MRGREREGDVRWRLWNGSWGGCKGTGSDRGWAVVGRRRRKKSLSRNWETLCQEGVAQGRLRAFEK